MSRIIEEMVVEWVQLRRQGRSYAAIARDYDVDSRTVQSRIANFERLQERGRWEVVSNQVDAVYLQEHHRLLTRTALELVSAVIVDPLSLDTSWDADKWLQFKVKLDSGQASEVLLGRGLELNPVVSGMEARPLTDPQLAEMLVTALLEHEPQLEKLVKAWKVTWNTLMEQRMDLAIQATSLLTQFGVEENVAESVDAALANRTLESTIRQRDFGSLAVIERKDGRLDLVLNSGSSANTIFKGTQRQIDQVMAAYPQVIDQLTLDGRLVPIEYAVASLSNSTAEIRGIVNILFLSGRPDGRCYLCPGARITKSNGKRRS